MLWLGAGTDLPEMEGLALTDLSWLWSGLALLALPLAELKF